jgi:hypothetical protein
MQILLHKKLIWKLKHAPRMEDARDFTRSFARLRPQSCLVALDLNALDHAAVKRHGDIRKAGGGYKPAGAWAVEVAGAP